jgi:hypothetical protein
MNRQVASVDSVNDANQARVLGRRDVHDFNAITTVEADVIAPDNDIARVDTSE